jgi:recombination protein RecA
MIKRLRSDEGGNYFAKPKSNIAFISSGSKLLDLALGGGWAERRIANVVGDKSSGKTLLMIEAAANFAIKYPKGKIMYREAESAFDIPYAKALGMPIDQVDFGDPEKPFETVEELHADIVSCIKKSKGPILYILDSLDALSDQAEMERDMGEGSYGAEKAKKLSQMFRRITSQMASSNMTLIIVSQVRDKIGVTFGRKTTRSGGRALDFYASQVLYVSHIGVVPKTVNGIKRPVAIYIKAKVDKNKCSLPFREAEFKIIFGYGIDDIEACLYWLKETKYLSDLELTELGMKEYLRTLNRKSDDEYWKEVKHIHQVIGRRWWDVEKSFLPNRRKY